MGCLCSKAEPPLQPSPVDALSPSNDGAIGGSGQQLVAEKGITAEPAPVQPVPTPSTPNAGCAERLVSKYGKTVLEGMQVTLAIIPDPTGVTGVLSRVLDMLHGRCKAAITNTKNCRNLLETVQWCRIRLEAFSQEALALAEKQRLNLQTALEEACNFVESFGKNNFWKRLAHASNDAAEFERHDKEIRKCTEDLTYKLLNEVVAKELSAATQPPTVLYDNKESEALRSAICHLGGTSDVQNALEKIKRQGQLNELARYMGPEGQVLMAVIEAKLEVVKLPEKLPPGLKTFWWDNFNAEEVSFASFFEAVALTIKDMASELEEAVRQRIHDELERMEPEPLLSPITVSCGDALRLLRQLLQAYTDPDANGKVDVDGFYRFWSSCHEWVLSSMSVRGLESGDMLSCCKVLAQHFEPKRLLEPQKAELQRLDEVLRPFHFSSDVTNLLTRFLPGSRGWLFEEFEAWLARRPEDPHFRAMVLYGGPGLGKSTVAAALVAKKVVGGLSSSVVGHWFCRHNDRGRSDPTRMIRTLAYQLAEAVPSLRPHLQPPKLTSEVVDKLEDPETAFHRLLLIPLREVKRSMESLSQPLVVVIDALDEVAVAGSSSLDNNPVLRLIREHFVNLPPAVRFILTSRPEPHIMTALDAAIHPLNILPGDPRHMDDLRALIQQQLKCRLVVVDGSNGNITREPTTAESSEAVQLLLDKSEGVFVYFARLLDSLQPKKQWTLADLRAFPSGLYATYTAFFEKHVGSSDQERFAETGLGRLLSVLLAVQEPPTLELLTAAWNAREELPAAVYDSAAGVVKVAEIMPSAEEQYKVELLLEKLGSLYSKCDGRMVVFHKSFHDFLESRNLASNLSNKFWVNSARGHRLLTSLTGPLMAFPEAARAAWPSTASASTTDSPSAPLCTGLLQYTLQYGPHHLVQLQRAGEQKAAGPLLDALVQNYAFLAAAFSSRHGHDLISALLPLFQSPRETPAIVVDALRWMRLRLPDLLKDDLSEEQVITSCLCCPLGTLVFKKAREAKRSGWRPTQVLGGATSWPACQLVLSGHLKFVNSVAWSPDGRQLASGSDDGTIRVWDTASGECLATLKGHSDEVYSVARSPDGRQLASGSADRTIRVWDTASGACVATLQGHSGWVSSVAWSPDGRQLASGSIDNTIRVWDPASGSCVATLKGHSRDVNSVAWSPDGRQLASGSKDNTIRVWEPASGSCVATLEGHSGWVSSVAWSPDGRQLASGSEDKTIRVWEPASGSCVATLKGHSRYVISVAWSPDGRQLASGSADSTIRVWEPASGSCVATLKGHSDWVISVAWSPDGRQLASGSEDNTIRVWEAASGSCVATLEGHSRGVYSVAWRPDGRQLASGGRDNTIHVWEAASGSCVATLKGHSRGVTSVAWSPDGRQLASGSLDDTIRVWEPASGSCAATLEGHSLWVSSVAWSPDGRQLASGSWDKTIRVWKPASGSCVAILKGHSGGVTSVAWSPDGRQLASGSEDNTIRVWEAASGSCVATLQGHSKAVTSVAWSPDGRQLASGSKDKTIRVWEPASGSCVATLQGHSEAVFSVAWSPDGQQLASGSWDKTIRVWEPASGSCVATLQGHLDDVNSVAWSPDGRQLASGSVDNTIRVWEAI